MFKRFRNNRNTVELPPAPTADEIFADLETFQVPSHPSSSKKHNDDSIEKWWQDFETYIEGHKNLLVLEKEIDTSKDKLMVHKKELEAKTAMIKNQIPAH